MASCNLLILLFLVAFTSYSFGVQIAIDTDSSSQLFGLTNVVFFGASSRVHLPPLVRQAQPTFVRADDDKALLVKITETTGDESILTVFDARNLTTTAPYFGLPFAADPVQQKYYTILLDQSRAAWLYVVDLKSGSVQNKFAITTQPIPTWLQFDSNTGQLFGLLATKETAQLVSFDLTTGKSTPLGSPLTLTGPISATTYSITSHTFYVFVVDSHTYNYFAISTVTGQVTFTTALKGVSGVICNAVFEETTQTIYFVQGTWFGFNFTTMNPQTGTMRNIVPLSIGLYWESLSGTGYLNPDRNSYSCVWLGNDGEPKIAARIDEFDLSTGKKISTTPFDIHHIPVGLALIKQ